jgi:hypothetical protein
MNKEKGLIALGIGASLAAAYCTYKFTNTCPMSHKAPKHYKKVFKTKDADGCSDKELDNIELTIINGDEYSDQGSKIDALSENSVPLSKVNIHYLKIIIFD